MLEEILGLSGSVSVADFSSLAVVTSIIVEFLKKHLPKKFPTKFLTIIVAVVVSIIAAAAFYGIGLQSILLGVLLGAIVAFTSMNGFDAVKSIYERYNFRLLDTTTDDTGTDDITTEESTTENTTIEDEGEQVG